MIPVKICGMRDARNVAEIALLRPAYIGFIFYKRSLRYISPDNVFEYLPLLKSLDIKAVAVLVNEDLEQVDRIIQSGFNVIQLHGEESFSYCEKLRNKHPDIEIIKVFGVDADFDFKETNKFSSIADYYLFDTKSPQHGGTGKAFNWDMLKKYDQHKSFFLSGGIGKEQLEEVLRLKKEGMNICALDMNSKLEIAPGLKSVELVKDVLSVLNREVN